jgi:hypothetical protein
MVLPGDGDGDPLPPNPYLTQKQAIYEQALAEAATIEANWNQMLADDPTIDQKFLAIPEQNRPMVNPGYQEFKALKEIIYGTKNNGVLSYPAQIIAKPSTQVGVTEANALLAVMIPIRKDIRAWANAARGRWVEVRGQHVSVVEGQPSHGDSLRNIGYTGRNVNTLQKEARAGTAFIANIARAHPTDADAQAKLALANAKAETFVVKGDASRAHVDAMNAKPVTTPITTAEYNLAVQQHTEALALAAEVEALRYALYLRYPNG